MAIVAKIRAVYPEPFKDTHYPTVEVVYTDELTEYGAAAYVLRPGSAIETLDDVAAVAKAEIARIESERTRPPPDETPPPVPREVEAEVTELRKRIGEPIDTTRSR